MKIAWMNVAVLLLALSACRTVVAPPAEKGGSSIEPASGGEQVTISYFCEKCNEMVYGGHHCGVSKPCKLCKTETDPPRHIHNVTRFCPTCFSETGIGHVCGLTSFCRECAREAGKFHVCNVTRYCKVCRTEVAPDHECGVTVYCSKCRTETGKDHSHGQTHWCIVCRKEVDFEHLCPVDKRKQ